MNNYMDAVVDLFLSPNFDPFETDVRPPPLRPEGSANVKVKAVGTRIGSHPSFPQGVIFEAAVEDSDDDRDEIETKRIGKLLAKIGDEFYESYVPKKVATSKGRPWLSISEQLKSVLTKVAGIKVTDPNYNQESEEAWIKFKEILSNSVSDTVVEDANKQLGALLLTLRGLSNLGAGVVGWARLFFLRYIRERHLDADMQRLNASNFNREQAVD